jgi:hypothetical protein
MPTGPSNLKGINQFPAIFWVSHRQDELLLTYDVPIWKRASETMQLNELCQTNPHVNSTHGVDTIMLKGNTPAAAGEYINTLKGHYKVPDNARFVETTRVPSLETYRMTCLKIAVGQSQAWSVSSDHARILSRL